MAVLVIGVVGAAVGLVVALAVTVEIAMVVVAAAVPEVYECPVELRDPKQVLVASVPCL